MSIQDDSIKLPLNSPSHKQETFALKEFATFPQRSAAYTDERSSFLHLMNLSHENILLPLAMWMQRDFDGKEKFYMLYPKAQCNLRNYLVALGENPKLTKSFVEHLILQLWSLAEAIKKMIRPDSRIHVEEDNSGIFDDTDIFQGDSHPLLNPRAAPNRSGRFGYHHDLKLENILIFSDGTWMISDVGTTILMTPSTMAPTNIRGPEVQLGDPVYGPPDVYQERRTDGGPDVWAFGCIILEILVTIFQPITSDDPPTTDLDDPKPHVLDQFYIDRANSTEDVHVVASFWLRRPDGTYGLRQPVVDQFEMLWRRTKDCDPFYDLTNLAFSMLSIGSGKRPSASDVAGEIQKLRRRAIHHLTDDEYFYLSRLHPEVQQPSQAHRRSEDTDDIAPSP